MGKYTVYLCDICKKEIRKEKEVTSNGFSINAWVTTSDSIYPTVEPEIEMCPSCKKSFDKWKKTRQ